MTFPNAGSFQHATNEKSSLGRSLRRGVFRRGPLSGRRVLPGRGGSPRALRAAQRAARTAARDRTAVTAAGRAPRARAGARAGARAARAAPGAPRAGARTAAHVVVAVKTRVGVSIRRLRSLAGEALRARREVVLLARGAAPVPGLPAVTAHATTHAAAAEAAAPTAVLGAGVMRELARLPAEAPPIHEIDAGVANTAAAKPPTPRGRRG